MEVALNSTFNLGMFMLKIACTNSWSNRRKVVRFCLNIDWIVYLLISINNDNNNNNNSTMNYMQLYCKSTVQ